MSRRPWPILVLAILQLFSPLLSILLTSFATGESLQNTFHILMYDSNGMQRFQIFAFPLIFAISLFVMNRWALLVLMAMTLINLVGNTLDFVKGYATYSVLYLFIVYLLAFGFIAYILSPRVREIFWNKSLRWWEIEPRYLVQFPVEITKNHQPDHVIQSQMVDLSQGGCAFEAPSGTFQPGDSVQLSFSSFDENLNLPSKVVYQRVLENGKEKFGVQFQAEDVDVVTLRNVLRKVRAAGTPTTRVKTPWIDDFKSWTIRAKQGTDAWFPEIKK